MTVLSRGAVQLDARAAREKLREYMLSEPALYVVELARAAAASGATAIAMRNDSDDLELTFDGRPFSPRTLVNVLDHVFDAQSPRERLLAIGINTALGLSPRFVDVYTSSGAGPTVTRVRWSRATLETKDGSLGRPDVAEVKRPPKMPERGTRIHVRERLGRSVLSEFFRVGAPIETVRLAEHATYRSIEITRGKVRVSPASTARGLVQRSARVPGIGDVHVSLPGRGFLDFAEHGFLLERRNLAHASAPWPVEALVESPSLPTNASRSQVALDPDVEAALTDNVHALVIAVVEEGIARLGGPEHVPLADALSSLLTARAGAAWPSAVTEAPSPRQRLDDLLLDAAIVPLATGGHTTPRALAAAASDAGVLVWQKQKPIDAALARFLTPVVWLRAESEATTRIVAPLGFVDATHAVARAAELAGRWERWRAHPVRVPAVDQRTDDELLRVPFGNALAAGDVEGATPRASAGASEQIVGEVVVRGVRSQPPLRFTAFVDGRPIGTLEREGPRLSIDVALGSPALRPAPELDGVAPDNAFRRAVAAAGRALLEAIDLVLRVEAMPDASDRRLLWVGPGLARTTPMTMAALARISLDLLAGSFGGQPGPPESGHRRLAIRPKVASVPVWMTTAGARVSTADLLRLADDDLGVICFTTAPTATSRPDGRPILLLEPGDYPVLAALLPGRARLVDCTRVVQGAPLPARALLPPDLGSVVLALTRNGARALITPVPSNGALVLAYRGHRVQSSERSGPLGPATLVIDDDLLVPDSDIARDHLSAEALELSAIADYELAATIALAAHGDDAAATALGITKAFFPTSAVAFAVRAIQALRARSADDKLRDEHPSTAGEIAELLDTAPFFEVQRAGSLLGHTSVQEIVTRSSGNAIGWLDQPATDIDLGALEPLVIRDSALVKVLEVELKVPMSRVANRVAQLREARAREDAATAWARTLPRAMREPAEITGLPVVRAKVGQNEIVASIASHGVTLLQIRWSDRVVEDRPMRDPELAMRAVVVLAEPGALRERAGLTPAGKRIAARLVEHAAGRLVDSIIERCGSGVEANDGDRAMVVSWIATLAPELSKRDGERMTALASAPVWLLAAGGRGSALGCVADGAVRTSSRLFPWWKPPLDATETEVAPAVHAPLDDDSVEKCLARLVDAPHRDVTDELTRVQTAREVRATVDPSRVRFPDVAPVPALAGSLDRLAPDVGLGEVRLVPPIGEPSLDLILVHAVIGATRFATVATPVAMAAIVQPFEHGAPNAERASSIASSLTTCARRLIDGALVAEAVLPEWAEPAVRWHVLTTATPSRRLLDAKVFRDSMGERLTRREFEAEMALHGALAFSLWHPPEPFAPATPLFRVVLVTAAERNWLADVVVVRDYTATLEDEWSVRRFMQSQQATVIRVSDPTPDSATRLALTRETHGYEGELVLLPWNGSSSAMVSWYHHRRPLGQSVTPSPWPAMVAIDVADLVPNRGCTTPTEDAAYRRTVGDIAELVHEAIGPKLQAPDDALASVHTWEATSPARTGDRVTALGVLWLARDASVDAWIDLYTSQPTPTRWTTEVLDGFSRRRVPVAGRLYFHQGVGSAAERQALAHAIVRWAYTQLLGKLIAGISDLASADAELAHVIRAIVDGTHRGTAIEAWADHACLPGSATTFTWLASLVTSAGWLSEVAPGDERESTVGYLVGTGAASHRMLRAHGLLRPVASPVQVGAPPPELRHEMLALPDAPPAAPTAQTVFVGGVDDGTKRVALVLRGCGLASKWVEALGVERGKGRRLVRVTRDHSQVLLDRASPAIAAWLAADDAASAAHLAAVVMSACNRASLDVTDDDEARVLVSLLETLASQAPAARR